MSEVTGETIIAPITAPGHSAVSVVRLSGDKVKEILYKLCPIGEKIVTNPRYSHYVKINDLLENENPTSGSTPVLDYGLVVFFKGPASFTGEDLCEFHLHGSPYLVRRLIENCVSLGARLAEPGEFSKRAFLNGKLDLSQVEAIADLVSAETKAQAKVAKEQLSGKLASAISLLGEPLRDLLAEIEAFIDFPEEDITPESAASWLKTIEETKAEITRYLQSFKTGKLYREGAVVSLVGLPNAGKSSLLNRLVGEERAIVTAIPGTTRDSIEERVSIGGVLIRFWDTAGLVDEERSIRKLDEVERLGIERSWSRLKNSDFVFYIVDSKENFALEKEIFLRVTASNSSLILLINKADLLTPQRKKEVEVNAKETFGKPPLFISALTGEGLEELRKTLENQFLRTQSSTVLITTRRHLEALQKADSSLKEAVEALEKNAPPELIALDIRSTLGALQDIVGVTYTDEILGRIFSKFCIGK